MKVLIIGVNGFLGPAIAALAASKGLTVSGLARSETPSPGLELCYLSTDRRSPDAIRDLVGTHGIDVVVDVIAMTEVDSSRLLSALDGRIAQYVMLSSCDVYRNYELLQKRLTGKPTLGPIDEAGDLRTSRYPYRGPEPRDCDAPDRHLDDYDKIPIEESVRKLASDWTILRLPMIYGPADRQRRFRWAVEPMAAGKSSLAIPGPWAEWVTTYAYVDNVADAIALTIGNDKAAGRVFNVGEPAPANHLEWTDRLAHVMDSSIGIKVGSDPDSSFSRSLESLDLTVPLRIDDEAIRRELGFTEIVDMETGLRRTIADELARSR
jgi:nucleoside-diphosphate-sugar epimerase